MTSQETQTPTTPPSLPQSTRRNLIDELICIPIIRVVCEKVSGTHTKLSRVLPFYAWLVGAGLAITKAVAHRIRQWDLVKVSVEKVEKAGLWALDMARGKFPRPRDVFQKVLSMVQKYMLRAAAKVASHPGGRLPCRLTLSVTGATCHFLEALKLDEDRRCLGEVFLVGRLQRVYNRTLTTLTIQLKTCHCVLKGFQESHDNAANGLETDGKKRKRPNETECSQTSDSSSDNEKAADSSSDNEEAASFEGSSHL